MPKGVSIYDLIERAQTPENIIGQGANSVVYNLPQLNDYVLKVLNKDDPNGINMDEFPSDVNLGQPVWQDKTNPRRLILKKIEGKEVTLDELSSEEKKELLGYIGLLDDDKLKNLVWEVLSPINSNMIVTTKEIDFVVDKLGLLISDCLNDCLHKIDVH